MEFGARIELSLDEKGMARIKKLSFDAYNESDLLIAAAERYYERKRRNFNMEKLMYNKDKALKILKNGIIVCLIIESLIFVLGVLSFFRIISCPEGLWNIFFVFAYGGIVLSILRAGVYRVKRIT